ncbi:Undecaprenyl-phosphate glycosylphosphotransferase [Candidatus Sulfobium mesophilum]|uniref:Undecaprenyl-phosphate glycosylphosphotransferase n=1 Tax=Candidatus Sulfobium mesophilum TaxID=2016548 RepID=A0A2U3QDK4_9BACT|nr:Undecaprenyl-phosphate glycosylphosphotransferase [Candidatus Sulfobium mesophilum]
MSVISRNPSAIASGILLTGDGVLGLVAFYISLCLRFGGLSEGQAKYEHLGFTVVVFVITLLFCSFFVELYTQDRNLSNKETLVRTVASSCLAFVILSTFFYVFPSIKMWRGMLAYCLVSFSALQFIWHLFFGLFPRLPAFAKGVLIFGAGASAEKLGELVLSTNHSHILRGYVTCDTETCVVPAAYIPEGGSLLETARKERAQKIVISLTERRGNLPLKDVLDCKLSGIDVLDAPSFYEQMTGKLLIEEMKPSSLIFSDGFKITSFKMLSKRAIDLALALVGSVVILPFLPILALLVKADSPGPVLFRQTRVGKGEKDFVLYKFRTMRDDAEKGTGAVWAEKEDCRITRVGKFLRKSRLDEVPQIYNVLKGDMSFIGPRPERPEFVEQLKKIIPYYSERHFVKPGITGWAQIKYPYGASTEDAVEKLRYDLYYIKHLSLFLDFLIVLETVKVVLFGRGSR